MDNVSRKKRSQIMSAIKSKNTKPEVRLRRELWSKGLRFRLHYGKEKIDIAFPSRRVAVFVDGCFWHRCPIHSHMPKSNENYWQAKLEKNIERDKAKNERLNSSGWTILRVWEHELDDLDEITLRIRALLARARGQNT